MRHQAENRFTSLAALMLRDQVKNQFLIQVTWRKKRRLALTPPQGSVPHCSTSCFRRLCERSVTRAQRVPPYQPAASSVFSFPVSLTKQESVRRCRRLPVSVSRARAVARKQHSTQNKKAANSPKINSLQPPALIQQAPPAIEFKTITPPEIPMGLNVHPVVLPLAPRLPSAAFSERISSDSSRSLPPRPTPVMRTERV